MRYAIGIATAVILIAVMFHSCTCEKATPPPPATLKEPATGFKASSGVTPIQRVQAPTPTAEVVAAGPTATVALPTPAAEVPKDFPVPVPEGSSVAKVQGLANDAHNVIFHSTQPAAELFNFYQDKLGRDGWQVTQQYQRGGSAFASFKKGDMTANVTIAEDTKNPGQRVLAIMYEHEKPLPPGFDDF